MTFNFIDLDGIKVVEIGHFIFSTSRMGKDDHVWIRRVGSCEGGDFDIEKLNEAIEKFFLENF
jgi:hypothetical protein